VSEPHFDPCRRRVTVSARPRPAARKPSVMDVSVAGCTCRFPRPAELPGISPLGGLDGMALPARDRPVPTPQRQTRPFMHGKRKGGSGESSLCVTRLARTLIGPGGELTIVGVRVAIGTMLKFRDVRPWRRGASRLGDKMTTRAVDCGMFSAERELCGCVVEGLRHPFAPTLFVVAGFARSARLALRKLSAVRIHVTVGACLELCYVEPVALGRRPPGTTLPVTLPALDLCMPAAKQKTGRGMVEILPGCLPTQSRVAAFARFLELPPVWVSVTRRTGRKMQPREPDRHARLRRRRVAPLTLCIQVFPRKPEFRAVVGEARRRFPRIVRVALTALCRELSLVDIDMTCCTITRQAKVRPARYHLRILEDIGRPDILFHMAFPAFDGSVLSFKGKSCHRMVKALCIEAEE
jgi:hypothetical protein